MNILINQITFYLFKAKKQLVTAIKYYGQINLSRDFISHHIL